MAVNFGDCALRGASLGGLCPAACPHGVCCGRHGALPRASRWPRVWRGCARKQRCSPDATGLA